MQQTFNTLDELIAAVKADKKIIGAGAYTANRYPVRFVLFDNFRDQYGFILKMVDSTRKVCIEEWIGEEYPDIILTYSRLADILESIMHNGADASKSPDILVTPFSELARFYDNREYMEFDALIATVKGIENNKEDYARHRRMYIPVVGLEGKMSHFYNDSQSMIWYLHGEDRELDYRLVMTSGSTYRVKNIETKYTVASNVMEWLKMWTQSNITKTILCTSQALYANAAYAQPDNAFSYCSCRNAHDFLVRGLGLELDFIAYRKEDDEYWEKLAAEIDINDFNFEKFFNKKSDIYDLADYKAFVKTWFEFSDPYHRWLLVAYYTHKFCNEGYICLALEHTHDYTNAAFVEALETCIFDCANVDEDALAERREALGAAAKEDVAITTEAQQYIKGKLEAIAKGDGYCAALKYMTTATEAERRLLIGWVGSKKVSLDDIKDIYPDLHAYMQPLGVTLEKNKGWVETYIDGYRMAKIANVYTDEMKDAIAKVNGSETAFYKWYSSFKTTTTLLDGKKDIEVFFWIDGLGIDWIPYIRKVVEDCENEGYYLNEVMIGKALLPTKTSVNKESLEQLTNRPLAKEGDIDSRAHAIRKYPDYLMEDMKVVKEALLKVLKNNPGRKIAIVSDHGMTFLSQLCNGLNLAGYESDHAGRTAHKKNGKAQADSKYIVTGEDGRTICALAHESLLAKVPAGAGCHGGCTPEEVLVPVFIISNHKDQRSWTANLLTREVPANEPYVIFSINGLDAKDEPVLIYDNKKYSLKSVGDARYMSDRIVMNPAVGKVTLQVGMAKQDFNVKFKFAAEEDDLFS